MFIKGDTVFLRALEPSDADLLYTWENDRRIWSVSYTQIPYSKFTLDEFVNAAHQDIYTNKQLRLMICRLSDQKAIGTVDLFEFDPQHNRCGLGIFIHEEARGSGSALESLQLTIEYAFSSLLLNQVYADINESNEKSLALFEKCGFQKSGLRKMWTRTAIDTYENVWFLQLINKEKQ